MKTKNLIFIGLGAVAVYLLFFKKKDTFANFTNYGSGDIVEEDPHNLLPDVTDINRR